MSQLSAITASSDTVVKFEFDDAVIGESRLTIKITFEIFNNVY